MTRCLSAGRRPLFFPGCWPMNRRLSVFLNPFRIRHVREKCNRFCAQKSISNSALQCDTRFPSPWGMQLCDHAQCKQPRRRYTGQQPGTKSVRGPLFALLKGRIKDSCRRCLGGTRDGCLLGEPIRRRPVLPGPAPPRRPAMRRPDPTRQWYVRVLDSTNHARHVPNKCSTFCAQKSISNSAWQCDARFPSSLGMQLCDHAQCKQPVFYSQICHVRKSSQGQNGGGPLVSSQGRRAAVFLLI